jgi:kynurenine formamidase
MTTTERFSALELANVLQDYQIVDLSVTLDDTMPCTWPGHMYFEHKIHNWYAPIEGPGQPLRSAGAYYTCWMTLDEHSGTHFDAPTHFVPPPDSGLEHASDLGSIYGDKVPLEALQGPATVADVRELNRDGQNGISPLITPDFLAAWEQRHGRFQPGDAVLLYTGWDQYYVPYPEGVKYSQGAVVLHTHPGWPAPSAEAVIYLYDRGVRLLGTDGPSIGGSHEAMTMHYAGLERGMAYVESLARLGELPVRGSYFIFMPLKIAQSSGGNGRALAFVPKGSHTIG